MATKKDETEKERKAREAREKAAKLRLHKPLASSSRMQRSDAGDLPELRGSVGSELIQADFGAQPPKTKPKKKRAKKKRPKKERELTAAEKKSIAKSEAFTQRVLERKRRHTEKTGSLSKPQHPSKIFVDDPDVKWTKASERGGAAVWKPSKSVGHGPLIKISTDGIVWHGSDKKGWSKLASD